MVEEKLKKLQELYDEGVKEEGTEKQQTEDVLKYIFIFTNSRSSPSPKSKDPRPLIYLILILMKVSQVIPDGKQQVEGKSTMFKWNIIKNTLKAEWF